MRPRLCQDLWLDCKTYCQLLAELSPQVVTALAPLVKLGRLGLQATRMRGDVGGFAPLVELQILSLVGTGVLGDVSGLAPLVELTQLHLFLTGGRRR